MKKIILSLLTATVLWSCGSTNNATTKVLKNEVKVAIDLVTIQNDKVLVTVLAPSFTTDETVYHIPKTIPGTYSTDNYGKFIEDFKAFDSKGTALKVTKIDENSWKISNAKSLDKMSYLVNDSFDTEKGGGFGKDVFSPAGSNIDEGKNFMINTHCFVGYFDDKLTTPYQVSISHPDSMVGATSMIDNDLSNAKDLFKTERYADLTDFPIMYCKPNTNSFTINGMDIQIAVYSPSGTITAEMISSNMKKMMTAQNNFLGKFKATKKYTVILYLSDMKKPDAKGFGALEHPTSTTVVFPEMMGVEALEEQLKDVVSHEFFHIVTPLTVHSQEIHNFDYSNPKMSQHLWMYEGVTEYFANLFQINQGLITEEEFYQRIAEKIENANRMNDTMPFTEMSAKVLNAPYKDQYLNVYEKGTLIGMCIDIIIREKSKGERGILDLMIKLSEEYGSSKAFNDSELFGKIVQLTYPEVGDFLNKFVAGPTPIPYSEYFAKVGVSNATTKIPENVFLKGQTPFITVDSKTKEISIVSNTELNDFMYVLKLKGGDIIKEVNGKVYNLDNIYDLIMGSQNWKDGEDISIKIFRDGKEQMINGKVKLNFQDASGLQATDASKSSLRNAWLKG